jgi:aspartate-semialdehyde dehydrogenase
MSESQAKRIVVFGATGHLGQQLIDKLDESGWPIGELLGVASAESAGLEFEFRGESLDVVSEWPVLKGRDLVFICTPPAEALEVVREALRAEVPCIDCSGVLANQSDVPMPIPPSISPFTSSSKPDGVAAETVTVDDELVRKAPLLSVPSGTTLAWAPILEALDASRVVGTALCSASAQGRHGVVALSQESIALFNQSEAPGTGPAGQTVAFDVIPGGGIECERVQRECQRLLGEKRRIGIASLQVPTFVGEGASLALELATPLDADALEARLTAMNGVLLARDGFGSRGLAAIEEDSAEPVGPTLRDAIGSDEILVGRIEADASLPAGEGWRLWIAFDPLRLVADQALRLAGRRLGLA